VPRGAAACDDCGACHQSGWKSDARTYDGLDLPDEDFDYDDFIQREFDQSEGSKTGLTKEHLWRLVAAILLAVMILGYFISAR
jgi:hypothetical protein